MADNPIIDAAPERSELVAPRRGRPPNDKPKPSDLIGRKEVTAMAEMGAAQFTRALWMLARFGSWIVGGTVDGGLSEEETNEGMEEAKAILLRFPGLSTVMAFLGFPMWLGGKVSERFRWRTPKEKKDATGLRAVESATDDTQVQQGPRAL